MRNGATAETAPKAQSGSMVPAPSNENPTRPFPTNPDSSEMANPDLWCPVNHVHLQDLSKERAEISGLLSNSISGFGSSAIKGSQ